MTSGPFCRLRRIRRPRARRSSETGRSRRRPSAARNKADQVPSIKKVDPFSQGIDSQELVARPYQMHQRPTSTLDWPPATRSTLPSGVICRGMSLNVGLPGLAAVAGRNDTSATRRVRPEARGPTRLFFGLCADGFGGFAAERRASGGFQTSLYRSPANADVASTMVTRPYSSFLANIVSALCFCDRSEFRFEPRRILARRP